MPGVADLPAGLGPLEIGGGRAYLEPGGGVTLVIPAVPHGYADGQLDDTRALPRRRFAWKPPLHLSVRARTSDRAPLGTLGFGFWNDPFAVSFGQGGAARRLPAPPRALWFFYASPPSDLAFVPGLPGHGWKAMALDSPQLPAVLLAPLAAAGAALAQIPGLRRPVLGAVLRAVTAAEATLEVSLEAWHEYELIWEPQGAAFRLDGETVLEAASPPPGPLGFVAWIDNQYAIASPRGGFHFGLIATHSQQRLDIARLSLSAADGASLRLGC